jgi:glucuronide carrier protein
VTQKGPLARLCLSSFFYLTGQNIIGALGIYIAIDVLGQYDDGNWLATVVTIITSGAVIYVAPFGPVITRRLGKKRGFMIAAAGAILGSGLFIVSGNLFFALVALFFAGVGMALLNTMTWALEADTVEYGEYRTGIRTEGATYAAFSFTRKVGQAVGAAIAGYGLAWAGYNGALKGTGQAQASDVLDRMQLAAGALPALCFLIALVIMSTYPLTEARFREIVQGIQANRSRRLAQQAALPTTDPPPTLGQ